MTSGGVPLSMKEMMGHLNSYISADPGVLTYLQGPLYTNGKPHWAVKGAAAIALLFKVINLGLTENLYYNSIIFHYTE